MAFITEPIIGDKRVQIGHEDFVRKMAIGNDWTSIRISLRLTILDSVGNFNSNLVIGLCNGFGYSSSDPSADFIGIDQLNESVLYTRASPIFSPPTANNISWRNLRKVGGVTGVNSTAAANTCQMASSLAVGPSGHCISIVRATATTYTVICYPASNIFASITRFQALQNAEGAINGLNTVNFNTPTLAGGSTYDYLNISWGASTPTLEISDMTVVRLL